MRSETILTRLKGISKCYCFVKPKIWGATGSASVFKSLRHLVLHWQSQWHPTPKLSRAKTLQLSTDVQIVEYALTRSQLTVCFDHQADQFIEGGARFPAQNVSRFAAITLQERDIGRSEIA